MSKTDKDDYSPKMLCRRAVILAVAGTVMGFAICLFISLISEDPDEEQISTGMKILYYAVGCLQGAIAMGATVVYEIEHWSILRATVTHFVLTFAAYFLMGYVQGWLVFGSLVFWVTTGCMVVAYIIIWLVNYFSYKRTIRRMNRDLKKLKK